MTIVDCTLLAEVDIISAGVVGLIALIVIVFAILSAKNWHWVNVVFLILTLITSITAIIGMTLAFQHRREGMLDYRKNLDMAEKAEAQVVEIVGGDPLSVQYGKDSLRYNNNQLALAMTGRGRAWPGVKISVAEGDQRNFELQTEDDLKEKAALGGSTMYAFAENGKVPNRYVGSVFVAVVEEEGEDDKYFLEPRDLADPERFNNPQTTWTLYEKMPLDRHDIFKNALVSIVNSKPENAERSPVDRERETFVEGLSDEATEFDIGTFTQILKRDFLPAERLGYDPDSLAYEQMIDDYAFDGQSVSKIKTYVENAPGRKNRLFEPTPVQVFIKYTFTAASETAVLTDGIGSLENDGMFNPAGEAVVGKLMENPEGVTFKKDDTILVDQRSSEKFTRAHAGKLKKVDEIFVRQLQDFPLIFKNRKVRVAKLEDEIVIAKATITKTQAALEDASKQIDEREDLLAKNTEDKEGLTRDSEALRQLIESGNQQSTELAEAIEARIAKIETLYQRIKALELERLRAAVSVSN